MKSTITDGGKSMIFGDNEADRIYEKMPRLHKFAVFLLTPILVLVAIAGVIHGIIEGLRK
jgi:hypothetical protein